MACTEFSELSKSSQSPKLVWLPEVVFISQQIHYQSYMHYSNTKHISNTTPALVRYLLPLTTLNRYLIRDSDGNFFFTTISRNISIVRYGLSQVA